VRSDTVLVVISPGGGEDREKKGMERVVDFGCDVLVNGTSFVYSCRHEHGACW